MPIAECIVCSPDFAPSHPTTFCVFHRRIREYYGRDRLMMEAMRQAACRERTDFPGSTWSHITYQISSKPKPGHWTVQLDDILRAYGVHQERPQDGPAGNESEAA